MQDAFRIPAAKAAILKEWDKLHKRDTWLIETVCEYDEIKNKAIKEKRKVHFGTLMPLCHQKNSELAPEHRSYKGRVVFRGDNVKDESGFAAVFSKQGTSASHIAAAKFLDAIA